MMIGRDNLSSEVDVLTMRAGFHLEISVESSIIDQTIATWNGTLGLADGQMVITRFCQSMDGY